MTMQTIWIPRVGGPEVLELRDTDIPTLGDNEVLIKVRAAGVNFADLMIRKGLYPEAPPLPLIPGYEISGSIVNTGKNIQRELLDRPVVAFTRFGGYSEYVTVPTGRFFPMPGSLSYESAAGLPVAYCTAYALIFVMGSLRSGDKLLIHNAGGAVGLAAFNLARQIGASVYGTAGSYKHAFLKAQGFTEVFDYNHRSWGRNALDSIQGKGFDLIIDPVGGSSWKKSYKLLGSGGRLGMYGISSACEKKGHCIFKLLQTVFQMPFFHSLGLVNGNRGVFGVNMARFWSEPEKIGEWMNYILSGIADGWIVPHIDRFFPFSEADKAHQYIESRKNIGKIILVP